MPSPKHTCHGPASPVLIQWFVHQQIDGSTALHCAANNDNEGCVRLLLESNASVDATDVSLERALPKHTCHGPATPVLIQWIVHQQNNGSTALMNAAFNGSLASATRLLEGGADLTLRANDGETALDYARSMGHSEVVALLSQPR